MTKIPEKDLSEASQIVPSRIRGLFFKIGVYFVSIVLAMLMIGALIPFIILFLGGLYGWAIAQGLFVPPIVACMRKIGFSDIWVEKTKKAITYSGAVFAAFAYFGFTFK